MGPAEIVAGAVLCGTLAIMLVELRVSQSHERALYRQGALDAPDEVYPAMRWAYPGVFVLMTLERLWRGLPPGLLMAAGVALFLLSKALKVWAIASLGDRWTYRVLVVPGAPLIARGPYAHIRHPNYVGVVGEIAGIALLMGAWVTGPISLVLFGWLLHRRIAAEERALGLRSARTQDLVR